jgi:hypothetical protein
VALRVAPVAHHDHVALDVPKVGIRLAAGVTQISLRRAPKRRALPLRRVAGFLGHLQRRVRGDHPGLAARFDFRFVVKDVVHLVVVDCDEFRYDVLALASVLGRPGDLLTHAKTLLEIIQLFPR